MPITAPSSSREKGATRATLRIVNDRQEIDFYYRLPGREWRRTEESAEISGMDHNVLGGFLDVRPAVCAYRRGQCDIPVVSLLAGSEGAGIARLC